jgi:hypothetical protein
MSVSCTSTIASSTVSLRSLSPKLQAFQNRFKKMYLVVIAWTYVVLLMSLAEAFSSQGSWLGAVVTFVLYGVLPLSVVVYILGTPARKRALKAAESGAPDASGHPPTAAQAQRIAPVGEEERRV